jgi:hypothetical protein
VTVRFLADEDLDAVIVAGLRSREPAIDIVDVKTAGLRGTKDPALLEIAAEQERILVTHDRRTMVSHVRERVAAGKSNPGLFIVPQRVRMRGDRRDAHSRLDRITGWRNGAIRPCTFPSVETVLSGVPLVFKNRWRLLALG